MKAKVDINKDSPNYMMYDASAGDRFVTHRAHLIGRDGDHFIVDIDGKTDGVMTNVPIAETLELN